MVRPFTNDAECAGSRQVEQGLGIRLYLVPRKVKVNTLPLVRSYIVAITVVRKINRK